MAKIKKDHKAKAPKTAKAEPEAKGYMNKEGMGESFLQAIKNSAEEFKGSSNSFLGVEKKIIDPKDFVQTLEGKK